MNNGTPHTLHEPKLHSTGVGIVLYPSSAFRAMTKATEAVYEAIRRDGKQENIPDRMQTRDELYERIGYRDYERKLDALFTNRKH